MFEVFETLITHYDVSDIIHQAIILLLLVALLGGNLRVRVRWKRQTPG